MSTWTYVNSSFLINFYERGHKDIKRELTKVFGQEVRFYSKQSLSKYNEKILPCGSEGTLYINVWIDSRIKTTTKCQVLVYGSLRDYDDEEELIDWFCDICEHGKKENALFEIESAIMQYRINEYSNILTYDRDEYSTNTLMPMVIKETKLKERFKDYDGEIIKEDIWNE